MVTRRLLTLLGGLLLAAAAHGAPPLPAPLASAFRAAGLPYDEVGLLAVPLGGGGPLLSLNADQPLNPASTMKLLTSYSALSMLGGDYRWRTQAFLRGRLADGVLDGDLVLKGGGDPKLVIEDLTEFVARMRRAGLGEIRGDLLIDDAIFDLDNRSVEQFDGDPSQPYNVRPHGMLMNFKATRFVVRPGASGVSIALDPPLADVAIDNDVRIARGKCRYGAGGLFVRDGGTEFKPLIRVSGSYSTGCGEQSAFVAVLSHRQFIHGLFKAAWLASGGVWNGQTRIARGSAQGAPWLEWVSPRTLADVVQDINKYSNNVMARQLLLQSAFETGRQPATPERARATLRNWLASQQLVFGDLVVDNGSGLSRVERITAANMAALLVHAAASPVADVMRGSLPRVGVDGTMRNRLVGDPVAGNAWIKTGSLNDVRAIAGYVDASSGRRYAVVMLVNGPRAELSQGAQDAVLRWVHANG
jgi:D-alanyl-D-alanine carboxypeptidase/D-alanyl-D-alanine-endopeptidase (penicillin-binding protein 4)